MAGSGRKVRVAVNVMRARLTMLGFNLAIITFQNSQAKLFQGGIKLSGFRDVIHLGTGTVLVCAAALSLAAMAVFLASAIIDENGLCEPYCLLAGDLLMYLALSQTVIGYFGPYLDAISGEVLPDAASSVLLGRIGLAMQVLGGTVWCLVAYAGPIVALLRSPCSRSMMVLLMLVYLVSLVAIGQFWTIARIVEATPSGPGLPSYNLLAPLVAPLYW